ncbi:DUF336-domain-containing protein [Lojkania enalia]|uniref:DUF336-domain-containing protein n=1 Tax=Lojkania enalia TaxID=147567 RepID=A0A9P4KJU4_9PLEO|nr:DUF336-domain-containing protein [Didymosphaeria enalia]
MAPNPTLSPPTTTTPTLTLSGARIALAAAETHALEIGVPMNIAIVDSSLHLLAFTRMDNAKLTSINIALDKAFTAAGHRISTSSYRENVWPGGVAFGINNTNSGRFCTIGGGVPILDEEGKILGAIGCSTGTPVQDEEVASKGRDAVLTIMREERWVVGEERAKADERSRKRKRVNGIGEPSQHVDIEEIVA